MLVVGVDSGSAGGLYTLERTPGGVWEPGQSLRMPFYETGRKQPELDVVAIVRWVRALPEEPALIAVETAGYLPGGGDGSGKGNAFTSARMAAGVGELVGACKALLWRWQRVRPMDWQRACGVKISRVKGERYAARRKRLKAAVAAFCAQRYPSAELMPGKHTTAHGGLVDALAIAHWAAVQVGGKLE